MDAWAENLNSIKRILIILPFEICFCIIAVIMAWQGKPLEAMAALGPIVTGIVVYYFGNHKTGERPIVEPDYGDDEMY